MEPPLSNPTSRAALLTSAAQTQPTTAPGDRKAARRARRAELRDSTPDPLLNPKEAAAEAGVAVSTWWKHVRAGRFPEPVYPLPRTPRWRRSVIRAAAECA